MSFPQTRHTLIHRLAAGGQEADWQTFLGDYWWPICRFALRRGNVNLDEAEDIASDTFEVLLRNQLLAEKLKDSLRKHVEQYCIPDKAADEFDAEWTRLGSHLQESGGLEEAIRRSSESLDPLLLESRKTARMKDTLTKISLAASHPSGKESVGQ